MKKSAPKLVLRRETLRMLSHLELARAAGGLNTGDEPSPVIYDSGRKVCTSTAAVATTAGG